MQSFVWMLFYLLCLAISMIKADVETTSGVGPERNTDFKCANGSYVDDECKCKEMATLCQMQPCLKREEHIQRRDMCNGIFDCSDLSDECLCDRRASENADTFDICMRLFTNFSDSRQCGIGHLACESKQERYREKDICVKSSQFCDGIIHCVNDVDESFCRQKDKNVFANDSNRTIIFTARPKQYFFCHNYSMVDMELEYNGSDIGYDGNLVFMDWRRRFDGVRDCSDASDEWHPNFVYCGDNGTNLTITRCPETEEAGKRLFASPENMVRIPVVPFIEWFIGIVGFIGNSIAAFHSASAIFRRKARSRRRRQTEDGNLSSGASPRSVADGGNVNNCVLVLFLCVCDLVMAVQILLMAFANEYYRGTYWKHDEFWQSGTACSIIGSLAIFTTQTNAFMMVVISFVRLYVVARPFRKLKLKYVIWACVTTYILAALFMCIPYMTFMPFVEKYFIHSAYIPNNVQADATVLERDKTETYVRKILNLNSSGGAVDLSKIRWDEMENMVRDVNPDFANWRYFGYYSQLSICIPPFVAHWTDPGLIYTFALLVIDFSAFLIVFCAYYVVFQKTRRNEGCACIIALGCCTNLCRRRSASIVNGDARNETPVSSQGHKSMTRDEEDYEMQKRILWIIGTDFACWAPICILTLVSMINPDIKSTNSVLAAMILVQSNCVVNPLVYSRRVRHVLKNGAQKCISSIWRNLLPAKKKTPGEEPARADYNNSYRPQVNLDSIATVDETISMRNLSSHDDESAG